MDIAHTVAISITVGLRVGNNITLARDIPVAVAPDISIAVAPDISVAFASDIPVTIASDIPVTIASYIPVTIALDLFTANADAHAYTDTNTEGM